MILAVVDFSYGYSFIGPSADSLALTATVWREHIAPLWVWGMGWLTVGAIMVVSAFLLHDAIGYAAAIWWKILWALTTMASWAFGGVDRGWLGGVVWVVVAAMVWDISGWTEPTQPQEPEVDE